jgi:hypothetical protein
MSQPIRERVNGYPISRNLNPQLVSTADCKPLGRETRKHKPQQVRKLAASLDRFGFVLPILIDAESRVVAGWGLVLAARRLGLSEVPAVRLSDLSEADLRALRLALNRIAEDAAWDREALSLEVSGILELAPQIDFADTGFEIGEIDVLLDDHGLDQEDELPPINPVATPVTRTGDLWALGEHRLLCDNALRTESYTCVLGSDKAQMIFADPTDNVPIGGHVSGLGKVKHTDFGMASGELSSAEFKEILANRARPCGELLGQRRHSLRLHGLAARAGDPCRRESSLQGTPESLRLGQEQRRDGLALSLAA